jgi:signal transduction histidine kinase
MLLNILSNAIKFTQPGGSVAVLLIGCYTVVGLSVYV